MTQTEPTPLDAQWIVDLRERLGLTQKELAELLGCDTATVSRWECRRSTPLPAFAAALWKLYREYEEYQVKPVISELLIYQP